MAKKKGAKNEFDWLKVADTLLLSRAIDDLEESESPDRSGAVAHLAYNADSVRGDRPWSR